MKEFTKTHLDQDCYYYYGTPFSIVDSQEISRSILEKCHWRNDKITFFGKTYEQPRKVAFFSDPGVKYTYSKITMEGKPWIEQLDQLREFLFENFSLKFNSCLVNFYRNGDDYMSWHSDNERELGDFPKVASFSFGAERPFQFKLKNKFLSLTNFEENSIKQIILENGSLLLMDGKTQERWNHCLPKRKRIQEGRLNLTFRNVYY